MVSSVRAASAAALADEDSTVSVLCYTLHTGREATIIGILLADTPAGPVPRPAGERAPYGDSDRPSSIGSNQPIGPLVPSKTRQRARIRTDPVSGK